MVLRVLDGVHFVLGEGLGHHAEDEVEAEGAEGCEAADVAEPEFAGLSYVSIENISDGSMSAH